MGSFRRAIGLSAVIAAGTLVAASPASGAGEPPLTVPKSELNAALHCGDAVTNAKREPVLLVHGTGSSGVEAWLDPANVVSMLGDAGHPACYVDLPSNALADLQLSAEYVVSAARSVSRRAGRPIALYGHSQGGLLVRWALTFWPSLGNKVSDAVTAATPHHGTDGASLKPFLDTFCTPFVGCPPAFWQQAIGSDLLTALNNGRDETPGRTAWTTVRSETDNVVQPQGATPTSALDGARNISIQKICPGRTTSHRAARIDSVSYAALLDAVSHPGRAKPARFPDDVCASPFPAGVDAEANNAAEPPATFTILLRAVQYQPAARSEPPVREYVTAEDRASRAAAAADTEPSGPGTTETFTYRSGGVDYSYIVYTPTSYRRGRAAPLLVMVHGCQTTAEQQMNANLYNPLAERKGFVVLYPDLDPSGQMQPGPLRQCWRFPIPTSQHRDRGDAGALAGMTRAVIDRRNIDPQRVYMMGMSAGGFMTSIMAAAYPDLYAAVGIASAGAYADGLCIGLNHPATLSAEGSAQLAYAEMGSRARVVPRFVIGGDQDAGIPPACADKAFEQGLRTNNLVISGTQESPISLAPASARDAVAPGGYSYTVDTYRDPAGCLIGERWLVHGMNHFWSGGSADPRWASWTDPKGPSGARASWRFFSHFRMSETAMPCATRR